MAIRPIDEYSGKVATPTAEYPDGKAQNITSPGDGTGTPWDAKLVNDIFGFQQYLTNLAGITPSGTPESATTSQYFEAIWKLLNVRPLTYNIVSDVDLTLTAAQNLYAKITITDTGVVLTTGRNVILDTVGRIFIFTNSTAQTLTVKTAAGTGVAIPAGGSSMLINDGTDVTLLTTATPTTDYELVNKRYVDAAVGTPPTVTGTATFTNATQNINLPGIGNLSGLEVGDVITIANSVSNDNIFTVEIITDPDNIVVNYEHRGGTTSKSLIDEAATAGVTVTVLAKHYNAPIGLGQGWCTPASARVAGGSYPNTSGRVVTVNVSSTVSTGSYTFTIDGIVVAGLTEGTGNNDTFTGMIVPNGSTYSTNYPPSIWTELR